MGYLIDRAVVPLTFSGFKVQIKKKTKQQKQKQKKLLEQRERLCEIVTCLGDSGPEASIPLVSLPKRLSSPSGLLGLLALPL